MKKGLYQRYGRVVVLLLILLLSLWVIFPFLKTIIMSLIIGFAFYPVYNKLHVWTDSKVRASLYTVGIIILCVIVPLLFIIRGLFVEIQIYYSTVLAWSSNVDFVLSSLYNFFSEHVGVDLDFQQIIRFVLGTLLSTIQRFIVGIPTVLLHFFIMLFFLYYLFKNSDQIKEFMLQLLPFSKLEKKHLVAKVDDVLHGVIFGNITTAIIQGLFAGLGYYISGMSAPILWTIVTIICALIPVVGTAIIWLPASLIMILGGVATGSLWQGVFLFIYGFVVVSQVDNLIRPFLISGRSHVHPVLVLFGAFGGLWSFGFVGLFAGPLILALLFELIIAYKNRDGVI